MIGGRGFSGKEKGGDPRISAFEVFAENRERNSRLSASVRR